MVVGEALTVEIWFVPAGPGEPGGAGEEGVLDAEERERADRFRRPGDRATYVAAHTALRLLGGARLGVPPADVRFAREDCPLCGGPHGRPTLADPACGPATASHDRQARPTTRPGPDGPIAPAARPGPDRSIATAARPAAVGPSPAPPLSFSLSRTEGLAVVALSPAVVGVDVETVDRPVELDDLTVALHPAELPVADRREALRLWVRKEAYLKGVGTGLGLDPATVDLSTDPPGWQVADVPAGDAAVGAVAVRSARPIALTVRRTTVAELAALLAADPTAAPAPHP